MRAHTHFPSLRSFQKIRPIPKPKLHKMLIIYSGELLAPCQIPKLEDYPLSAVRTVDSVYSQLPSISGGLLHQQPQDALCVGDKCPTYKNTQMTAYVTSQSYVRIIRLIFVVHFVYFRY
jgi:hypothetical protein